MPKKRLLHISLGTHNTEMWQSFERHFVTQHYDWTPKQTNIESLNSDIIFLVDTFKPEIVFMQLQGGGIVLPRTINYINKNAVSVLWNGDVRTPIPRWELDLGGIVDITLHTNMHYVNELQKLGVNAQYLQVGYDENIFNPNGGKSQSPEIIFLGSNYIHTSNFPLSNLRVNLVRRLKQTYENNFMAYGNSWQQEQGVERFLNLHEEAAAYRSCKIAINLSHFDYGRYSSDRMLRLMGSGAFCLSHNFKDIQKDFEIGKHIDVWNNIEELVGKINSYLNEEDKRNEIAKNGPYFPGIICKMYSPNETNNVKEGERCFYTRENALIIDTLRKYIAENVEDDINMNNVWDSIQT